MLEKCSECELEGSIIYPECMKKSKNSKECDNFREKTL